jgi:MFS family permease
LNEHDRGPFFSIATAGGAFGAILAGTAGSLLLTFFGWPEVFRLIGVSGLVWAAQLKYMSTVTQKLRPFVLLPSKEAQKEDERSADCNALPIDEWHSVLASPAFW